MYVLIASFDVKPEQTDAFRAIGIVDAQSSTSNEPGCLSFSVLQDQTDPTKFVFFEVYRDEAAFHAHTETPHFAKFREATQDVYASPPSVVRANNVWPADADWK